MTLLSSHEKRQLLRWMDETFGISAEELKDLALFRYGKDVWMSAPQTLEPSLPNVVRTGMRLARKDREGFRLTTPAIQLLGARATKRVIELSYEEAEIFIRGGDLSLPEHSAAARGQVIVRVQGRPLGSGSWRDNRLKSQVPVAHRVRSGTEPIIREASSSFDGDEETAQ